MIVKPKPDGGDIQPPPIYLPTEGVRWIPLFEDQPKGWRGTARGRARVGLVVGIFAAAIVLILVAILSISAGEPETFAGLLGIGGAVAAGLFMVFTGVGLLASEALRAVRVTEDGSVRTPMVNIMGGAGVDKVLITVKEGLQGLTPARALIFAGAFILAVAALGSGISSESDAGDIGGTPAGTAPATTTAPNT